MANNMTPEQDLITRAFFTRVTQDDTLFPTNKATQRRLAGECLRLLNYVVVDGKFVDADSIGPRTYGAPFKGECQWAADEQKAREELGHEADHDTSADQTDSSEPTESTSVWKTLLREDV